MTVVKRSKESSVSGLVAAIDKFIEALATQGEDDAIKDLEKATTVVKSAAIETDEFKKALADIKEAYEEHELDAYTFEPKSTEGEWGPTQILYVTSTQVLSILKRFGV
jgi:hypothetical protein